MKNFSSYHLGDKYGMYMISKNHQSFLSRVYDFCSDKVERHNFCFEYVQSKGIVSQNIVAWIFTETPFIMLKTKNQIYAGVVEGHVHISNNRQTHKTINCLLKLIFEQKKLSVRNLNEGQLFIIKPQFVKDNNDSLLSLTLSALQDDGGLVDLIERRIKCEKQNLFQYLLSHLSHSNSRNVKSN